MKEGINMEKSIEKSKWIWLSREDNPEIISQGNLVVTDETRFNKIITNLRDISKYIYAGCQFEPGLSQKVIEYTSFGAVKYQNYGETEMYIATHYKYFYGNPRAELYQLLTEDRIPNYNLLNLFATLESENNTEDRLEELKRVKEIISQLENCSLPLETVKETIKQMWPNFGYYATDVLNCTDIEMGQEYNVQELSGIVVTSEKFGVAVSDDVRTILSKAELAQNNTKVLSLARRANRLVNPSK